MYQFVAVGLLVVLMLLANMVISIVRGLMAPTGAQTSVVFGIAFTPILVFYLVHLMLYFSWRLARGKNQVGTFTGSAINFISLAIAFLFFTGKVVVGK